MSERSRRVPINKRFPGQHVARFQLWTPDGSLLMEGPITKEAARAMVVAFTNSDTRKKKPPAVAGKVTDG